MNVETFRRPCLLDLRDDLLVLCHELAEGIMLGCSLWRAAVGVVGIGAEEPGLLVRAELVDELHMRVMAIPQVQGVLRRGGRSAGSLTNVGALKKSPAKLFSVESIDRTITGALTPS